MIQHRTYLIAFALPCILLLGGCSKPADNSGAASTAQSGITNASVKHADEPQPGEKICFACNGTGEVKCTAPGCVDGKVDCPGPCLKLNRGTWVHLDVPGHPATDLWQKFYLSDGSYTAFNQNHVGHVIVIQNGKAEDTGPCKTCGGTGKVSCSVCKGTGKTVCPICEGKKFIPIAWTPTDNPRLSSQPDVIRLNDGTIVFGRIMSIIGTDVGIKTREGKWIHVNATNIAPKSAMISTNPAD